MKKCNRNLFYLLTLFDCVFGMMDSQSNCSTLGVSFRFCALSTISVSESVQCALCIVWMCVYAVCCLSKHCNVHIQVIRLYDLPPNQVIGTSICKSINRVKEQWEGIFSFFHFSSFHIFVLLVAYCICDYISAILRSAADCRCLRKKKNNQTVARMHESNDGKREMKNEIRYRFPRVTERKQMICFCTEFKNNAGAFTSRICVVTVFHSWLSKFYLVLGLQLQRYNLMT